MVIWSGGTFNFQVFIVTHFKVMSTIPVLIYVSIEVLMAIQLKNKEQEWK